MSEDNYLKKELYELIKTDERIFDLIQEGSLDGLWYWDLENPENEWMNARFWKVLGYDPDKMPHKSAAWQDIIHQEDLKVANENLSKHCENPNHPYDQVVRYTHKDGSTVWIRCRGLAIRDKNGKPSRMLGAHQDISDIKRSEQELSKSKEKAEESKLRYRRLFENMNTGFVLFEVVQDEQGIPVDLIILAANDEFEKTTGLNLKNAVGKHLTKVLPGIEMDEANWIGTYSKVALSGEPIRFEQHSELLGYYYNVSAFKAGPKQCAVTFMDITESKRAEEALKATNQELKKEKIFSEKIVETTDAIIVGLDKDHIIKIFNRGAEQITGYKKDEVIGKDWFKIFFPKEMLDEMNKVWEEAWGVKSHSYINPILAKSGVERIISWQATGMYDSDDLPKHLVLSIGEDITERKKAELLLQEKNDEITAQNEELNQANTELNAAKEKVVKSEYRFRQVSEVAEELIWEIDTNGLYTYVSPVIESLLGYTPDEIVGKKYFYDLFIPEKREEFKQSAFNLIYKQEIVKTFENTLLHKDGHRVYVSTSGSPIFDNNGNLRGYRGIDIDITARKQAEEAARKSAERAEKQRNLIAELSISDAVVNGNIEQALELVTTKLAKLLEVDRVSVWLLSEEDSVLQRQILFDASHGIESQIEGLSTTDIPSYFKAMRRDSIVIAEDAQNNPSTKELADHYLIPLQISSLLDTAIQQEGQLKGVLSAEHRGLIRHWHSDEVSFLSAIGNLIAQLYTNAERKKTEDKLRESESRFRKIYDNPANGMVLAGTDLKFFMANQAFCQMTGYKEEDLKELTFNDITHPDDIAKDMAEAKKMMAGEVDAYGIEKRYIKKNGQTIWVNLSVSPFYDSNNQLQYFIGIVSDITRRKKVEQKNLELQEKFERISLHLPGVIYQFRLKPDGSFHFPYASPVMYDIYGVNPEEVEDDATASFSVLHPDYLEQVRASINYSAQTLTPWHDIYRVNHPRGETIWVEGESTPEKLDDGSIIWHGYIQDITKRKQAEDKIKQSLREKEVLLSEIHHRVKNNLAVVSGMMQLQSFDEENPEIQETLSASITRIKAIAKIHEKLYQHETFSSIDLAENIRDLTQEIVDTLSSGKAIEVDFSLAQVQLNINQAVPCSLIVNEVIVNALKHAFVEEETWNLSLHLSEQENQVQLTITDNGIGLPEEFSPKNHSIGTMIIQVLTEQLEGEYRYKNIKTGTEFSLAFEKTDKKGSSNAFL